MAPFRSTASLEDLRAAMSVFVAEREWHKFHTPRNVLLALVGEVGEVAELFQWRGEVPVGLDETWSAKDRENLSDELADVQVYLVRLADLCGISLPDAAIAKMQKNRLKYPVEKCRGSSAKYTAYVDVPAAAAPAGSSSASAAPAAASASSSVPASASLFSLASLPSALALAAAVAAGVLLAEALRHRRR